MYELVTAQLLQPMGSISRPSTNFAASDRDFIHQATGYTVMNCKLCLACVGCVSEGHVHHERVVKFNLWIRCGGFQRTLDHQPGAIMMLAELKVQNVMGLTLSQLQHWSVGFPRTLQVSTESQDAPDFS